MTQRDLDDLFKSGSEQYDFSYRPDAWEQMDALLDKQGQSRRRRWILLFFLLGLGLAGLTYYWNASSTATMQAEKVNNPIVVEQAPIENTKLQDPKDNLSATPALEENQTTQEENVTDKVPNLHSEVNTSTEYQTNAPNKPNAVKSPRSIVDKKTKEKDTKVSTPIAKMPSPVPSEPKVVHNPQTPQKENMEEELPSVIDKEVVDIVKYSYTSVPTLDIHPTIAEQDDPLADMPEPEVEENKIIPQPTKVNWAIGAIVSTDLNSVGFMEQTQMGWNIGLTADTRLGEKFSLGLGISFSKKDYMAGEGKYKVPGMPYISPKLTWADCKIIQVPLQLTYYKNGFSSKGFFASVGLNSYFMSLEKFKFEYGDPEPVPLVSEWEERGTNKHIFGVSQFNVGYQGKIGHKTLWQISPYIQVPLSGIGHGGVDLYSYGIQMNFKLLTK